MANLRYILIVLAICFAGYGGLFLFGRSPAYCALTKSYADLSPCHKFAVSGQDAAILLVGDSSLLYGIKPDVVESVAHRSVYNYGVVGPVFSFNPDGVIDHYLAHNRRPRAIIVYVSPWDQIDPGKIHDPVWFPVGLTALQHGDLGYFARLVRARPAALVELPPIIMRSIGFSRQHNVEMLDQMTHDGGHFDYAATLSPNAQHLPPCKATQPISPAPETQRSRAAIGALRARFAAQGLPVYFYVAPFANCGADIARISQAYRGLADNIPTALPDELFASGGESTPSVHVNAQGAERVSKLLGQFIATQGIGSAR